MRWNYADALYTDTSATLDELREAVTTLEDLAPTARRVLGGAHPDTGKIEGNLQRARAALRARETLVVNVEKALQNVREALAACETPSS